MLTQPGIVTVSPCWCLPCQDTHAGPGHPAAAEKGWVPSLLGLGCWLHPLCTLLTQILQDFTPKLAPQESPWHSMTGGWWVGTRL